MCVQTLYSQLLAGILLTLVPAAHAALITFDDLPTGGLNTIPRPYHGLIFSSSPYNGIVNSSVSTLSGVSGGIVSTPNVLLTDSQSLSIQSWNYEQGARFTFESGYFTAANQAELQMTIIGVQNGQEPLTRTLVLSNTPIFVNLNWANLDEITFTGISNGIYNDTRIVMDNITIDTAPEPALGGIIAIILVCLFLWNRKRGIFFVFT